MTKRRTLKVEYELYEESTEDMELVLFGENQSFYGEDARSLIYQAVCYLAEQYNVSEKNVTLVRKSENKT